eukprot:1826229-Amphidinium_carterae.1
MELKHMSQLTTETPLEFLGKSIELQQDGSIHLSILPQHYHNYGKILKPHAMERCNSTTPPGSKKPPIKGTPLNREEHSQYRATVGQLLWVSQLSRSLQCPDEEDQHNMKQLLRYINYKVQLKPKVERNHNGEIK